MRLPLVLDVHEANFSSLYANMYGASFSILYVMIHEATFSTWCAWG